MSSPVPDPHAAGDPPAPAPEPAPGESVRLRCGNCGAPLAWDPDTDALSCDHCGTTTSVPRGEGLIVERPLADAGQARRGLGLETRTARCTRCGAGVRYDERATATECVFCGSPQVLEQESNRNALRPESLVPLDVGRATAEQAFRRWLSGLWFRPSALRRLREFQAVGVYVPFWTFDCRVHSEWSADAGYYYYVPVVRPVMVRGKLVMQTTMERRVRWEPAWGARDDAFDDVLVHASRGLPEALAHDLGAYDLSALVPYRPEYLAGWRAEEYAVDLESGWQAAQAHVVAAQERRCSGDVPGDTQRRLAVANTISEVRWKHVLLPLWSLSFRHGGRVYPVLIHGQTGRVHGRAPYSPWKIAGLVLAILAGLLALLGVLAVAGVLSG